MATETYEIAWNYASSYGGPWMAGDKVQLDEDVAAMVNSDSPGVLKGYKADSDPIVEQSKKNRMVTQAETREGDWPRADRVTGSKKAQGAAQAKDGAGVEGGTA